MFCTSCGSKQSKGVQFCPNCGARMLSQETEVTTSAISATNSTKTGGLTGIFKNRKAILATSGAAIALVAGVLFFPKPVEIQITVDAVYGGVFDSNCNVDPDVESRVPTEIVLTSKTDGTGGVKVPVSFSKGNNGECIGLAKAAIGPFDSSLIFASSKQIGKFSAEEVTNGKLPLVVAVEVTRPMRVNFNLYEKADRCSGSTESWSCSWDWDAVFGLKLNNKTGSCRGKAGFSDIKTGTTVKIRGMSNGKTLTGSLVNDTYELVSVKSKQIVCKFFAEFSEVPNDEDGYEITVSNRGDVFFDKESLKTNSWVADLVLNK